MRPDFLAALAAVVALLGFTSPVAAQDGVPPLKRIIDISLRVPAAVDECSVASTVVILARRFGIVAGVEYPRSQCEKIGATRTSHGESINLQGMTVEQAFATLASMDPRYRMVEHDGVVVLRPVDAWSDPKNILNFSSPRFALENVTLGLALDALLSAMVGDSPSTTDRFGTATEQGARRFSVKTGATAAGGALDAIVRAHGAAIWVVREGEIGRAFFLHTFDGGGIGASRRGLQ